MSLKDEHLDAAVRRAAALNALEQEFPSLRERLAELVNAVTDADLEAAMLEEAAARAGDAEIVSLGPVNLPMIWMDGLAIRSTERASGIRASLKVRRAEWRMDPNEG